MVRATIDECVFTKDCYLDKDGYPRMKWNGKLWGVHRWVYTLVHGKIPENHVIGHSCNNKGCINPHHLYLTTAKENSTHAARDGLYFTGHLNVKIKNANDAWFTICDLYYNEMMSQKDIGIVYGISQTRVSEVIKKHKDKFFGDDR